MIKFYFSSQNNDSWTKDANTVLDHLVVLAVDIEVEISSIVDINKVVVANDGKISLVSTDLFAWVNVLVDVIDNCILTGTCVDC